jgi:hypothetical protein
MMNCDKCTPGFDRRNFLRFGLTGAAGAVMSSIPHRLMAQGTEAKQASGRTAKAVIMLWMGGGPTQIDTWDPKPGSKNGGEFKPIDTTGGANMKFSEHMKVCASQGKHMSIVRSMNTHEGSHERGTSLMHIGINPVQGLEIPPTGTVVSFEKGKPEFPLPHFIAIDPPLIPQATTFGDDYMPFRLNNADNPIPNIRSPLGQGNSRDKERAALLIDQNKEWDAKRVQKEVTKVEKAYVKSEDVMNTPLLKAFNYHDEPADLRSQYGDRFGINCLLARRLVQAGCSFVEIGLGGWDMHADVFGNCKRMLPTLDAGMGTLIKDLAEKDMLKETLVIWCGEFGRTPSINAGKGRDHHADGFSVAMAGGGLAGGRVYGNTGPNGDQCQQPVPIHNLFASIYAACGIDGNKKYETEGRKIKYVSQNGSISTSGTVIKELF